MRLRLGLVFFVLGSAAAFAQSRNAKVEFKNSPEISSPAVGYGGLLFVSGKASYSAPDPKDIRSCVTYALDQVEAELKNAGSSMDKVLKVQIFLRDINDYAAMNEIFAARFAKEPPTRTTVAAIIPRESLVEIDAVAFV